MKKIKRVGAVSLGKILGIMYGFMGLVFGGIITLFSFLAVTVFSPEASSIKGVPIFFGTGAIVFVPLFYGVLGFIIGIFSGWVYNLATRLVGGLDIEFEDK